MIYNTPFHKENLQPHTFLVTGGAGFIGSNLVKYLLKFNVGEVRVLDNFETGFKYNIESFVGNTSFRLIEGDIRNPESCQEACRGVDIILHQAALGSVPRSVKDPILSNSSNVNGFLNMLVAAKDNKVKRFVYASSSSVYGDNNQLPKKEENIGKPLSPYAVTKLINEQYADVFYKIFGLELIGLRYFNVFGPHQSPQGAYAAVIPLFINAVLQNESPIIFGDGEQTRDFTFIENVVQANIKAAFVQDKEAVNQVYNIGLSERISLNQLFDIIKQKSGAHLDAIYKDNRAGDVRDSLADISKARRLLNYNPAVKIEEGLAKTLEWFQNQYVNIKSK